MTTNPQKPSFGELRKSGVRDVLTSCRDHRCSHHIAISADRWPDDVRLSDIERDFVSPPAAIEVRKCGRSLIPRRWEALAQDEHQDQMRLKNCPISVASKSSFLT